MRMLASTKAIVCLAGMILTMAWPSEAAARRAPAKGALVIESMTDGAKVYIDGKLVGKTPFDKPLALRPGKHKLKATKFGYAELDLEFKVRARRKTVLTVDLVPHSGLVRFTCNLDGAEVYIDGKLLGHTPLNKVIEIGDHAVMIVKEGYNDFSAEINVKAGEKHFVDGVLTLFQDFSPEVLALKKAQEDEARRRQELAAQLAKNPPVAEAPISPAPAWYDGFHRKWWFWTAVGAVVLTAVVVPVAATASTEQAGLKAHASPVDPIRLP